MPWRLRVGTVWRERGSRAHGRTASASPSGIRRGLLSTCLTVLWWSVFPGVALAQGKAEVPQGYEKAAPAGKRPAAARAAPAGDGESLLEVLTDALGEKVDPNVLRLEQQYKPQFEKMLTPELAFVRRVCDPDEDQLRDVVAAARDRLDNAVREYAVVQNRLRQGGAQRASRVMPQPRDLIEKQVIAVVKSNLRPEQAEGYEKECELRALRRKRAVVLNLVAKLDHELALSAEQREKLVESLTENYRENWNQWIQMLMHGANASHMPDIPSDSVFPVLNEKQKDIWRRLPKTSGVFFGGMPFAAGMVAIEDEELEELGNAP